MDQQPTSGPSVPTPPVPTQPQPPTGIMQRIVGWLRAGYPEGVPAGDYVALLGVLRRKLTDQDIETIVQELVEERRAAHPEELTHISPDMIRDFIRDHALQEPKKKDVARVSAHLAAAGWPLGDPELGDDRPLEDEAEPPADDSRPGA